MIDYIKVYCGIPILVTAYDSKLILFRSIAIKLLEKNGIKADETSVLVKEFISCYCRLNIVDEPAEQWRNAEIGFFARVNVLWRYLMIFSQVTLQVETTVKKKNGAEANVIKPIVLPAVKQRISQSRLDEFSMVGLGKNVRYELNGIGEMEDLIFNYFLDEKGETFKRTTWERNPKNNKMILEGVVSNGI